MSDYVIYYSLTLIAIVIVLGAQGFVSFNYKKYLKVRNSKNITGGEVARKILDMNGLNHVKVEEVSGTLSDHYDPRSKTVRLSSDICNGNSISSVAVAAHECGHAIQDKDKYIFMNIRSSLVPITNLSSKLGYVVIVLGLLFSLVNLIFIGIILEVVILLFQLVTLPVEFNASNRALKILKNDHLIEENEVKECKHVLSAAALTYVASVAASLLEILRLVLIFTRRD